MKFKEIKTKVSKEQLKTAFDKNYTSYEKMPRFIHLAMLEALIDLKIANTTKKVSSHTLEALAQWIEA